MKDIKLCFQLKQFGQLTKLFFIVYSLMGFRLVYATAQYKINDHSSINWSNIYMGFNLGEVWTKNLVTWSPLPSAIDAGISPILGHNSTSNFSEGIFGGYNHQFLTKYVVGLEGDFLWSNATGSLYSSWYYYGTTNPAIGTYTNMKSTLNWSPSIHARLGYIALPNLLTYGAVGPSWAKISYAASDSNDSINNNSLYTTSTSYSKIFFGFSVGGGMDWAITKNLLVRAEYMFYQFSNSQSIVAADSTGNNPSNFSNYVWSDTSFNLARAGLIYMF